MQQMSALSWKIINSQTRLSIYLLLYKAIKFPTQAITSGSRYIRWSFFAKLHVYYHYQLWYKLLFARMSMNTRDERLYHYEYRRPRINNPTYNSGHVFESLNMFARLDNTASHLPGNDSFTNNRSEVMNYRGSRPLENYSMELPPAGTGRQTRLLNDKDSLYLQMIDQKNRSRSNRNTYDMRGSHLSQNAENREQYSSNKKGDSLTREVNEFDSHRK